MLARFPIEPVLWRNVVRDSEVLEGLSSDELARLHDLVALFVHRKKFFGTHELIIDDYLRIAIASQACLAILNLDTAQDTNIYPGWQSIIIYPGAFVARHDYRDQIGVVHEQIRALEGEASRQGPVVLSWEDARPGGGQCAAGRNVVLHEFAHKLDFLDGTSNGHPPLHGNMSTRIWSEVFTAAFNDLSQTIEHHRHPSINPYAATNPAEFFAVSTELFFTKPHYLRAVYPDVYTQLVLYYAQDPSKRRK